MRYAVSNDGKRLFASLTDFDLGDDSDIVGAIFTHGWLSL